MAEPVLLCAVNDLEDRVPIEVTRALPEGEIHLIIGRLGDEVFAYENVCPHQGRPLNWAPDQFLMDGGRRIVCANHGASFELNDGSCVSGPCQGVGLKPVKVEVREGKMYLAR